MTSVPQSCFTESLGSPAAAAHADVVSFVCNASRDAYALKIALETLEQIATTPRNRGAKRNAAATLDFIRQVILSASLQAE